MSGPLFCSCGKRRRCADESPATHGPECCTCPPGTRVHIKGCIASYGSRVAGLQAEPEPTGYASSRGAKMLAAAALVVAFGAGATAHHWNPWATTSIGEGEGASVPDLVRYEDGSGVLYDGDQEIATYPEGTFPRY